MNTNRPVQRLALLLALGTLSLAVSGEEIVFSSDLGGSLDLWRISPDGASRTNISAVAHDPLGHFDERVPQWSPDGEHIAFTSDRSGSRKVWVMNADGTGDFELSSLTSLAEQGPYWAPDGKRIYFARNKSYSTGGGCAPCPQWEIWYRDLESGVEKQLTDDSSRDVSPVVSPDGTSVVFAKAEVANDCCGPTNLWIMDAEGGNPAPLHSSQDRYEWAVDWSRLTGGILGSKQFASSAQSAYEIVVFGLDGSIGRLTENGVYDFPMALSPDGSQILYYSTRSGTFELYIGDASNPALNPFQLTAEDPTPSGADWRVADSGGQCENEDSDSACDEEIEDSDSNDSDDSDSDD